MATIYTQTMLDQARAAYHDLMLGKSARVVVDQNGERVEFTSANADKLRAYIAEMVADLAGVVQARGPLRPYF